MNQSGYIAAFLIIGFIVFITLRGELPTYLATFGLGDAAQQQTQQNAAATTGNTISNGLSVLPSLLHF